MSLQIGLVGLPNSGKTTLFNALTAAGAAVAPYPFTTLEPNIGVGEVVDERLEKIAVLAQSEKIVHTTIEFVDIPGLVKGASAGEGLGNRFLGHIRDVDALCFVLRCFHAPDVPHVAAEIDPRGDKEVLDLELSLADLATVENRLEKVRGLARSGLKEYQTEFSLLEQLEKRLARGTPLRHPTLGEEEATLLRSLNLHTAKPRIYVANVGEEDLPNGGALGDKVVKMAKQEKAEALIISAKIEAELLELPAAEAVAYRQALGLPRSASEEVILAGYRLLDLISFFTIVGGKEARAWAIRRGTLAPQAAGKVHSDMERGFIRAEVIPWNTLLERGSLTAAREAGAVHSVGRDYQVEEGDVIQFRFQV